MSPQYGKSYWGLFLLVGSLSALATDEIQTSDPLQIQKYAPPKTKLLPKPKPIPLSTPTPTPKTLDVQWLGCPMYSDDDKIIPSQSWMPMAEIGLREDGVVVWRHRERKF